MSRVLLFAAACIAIAFAGTSGDNKPDFTGNWTLNLDRSNFGKADKPMGMTLKVTRDGDTTHAVQTTELAGGPTSVESNWILDGQEHDATDAPQKVMTKWEGNTLYSQRRANDGSLVEKIWLTLSSDGKTATEKVYTKRPEGVNTSTLIWTRP